MAGKDTIKKFFSDEDLQAITDATTEAESQTCAEIRVMIVPTVGEDVDTREFAEQQFLGHGLHKTDGSTGVLLMLALDDRKIEVVADDGIDAKVDQSTWDGIVSGLSDQFRSGDYLGGIKQALKEVASVCTEHFPIGEGDRNELDNAPITE